MTLHYYIPLEAVNVTTMMFPRLDIAFKAEKARSACREEVPASVAILI
jgi:hypothetical protein